jgi:hypothetical protein
MPDEWDQFKSKPAQGGDEFDQFKRSPAQEDVQQFMKHDEKSQPAPIRFMSRIAENLNPVPLLGAAAHPIENVKAIAGQTSSKLFESAQAAGKGQYGRSALSLAEAVPLVGSMVSQGEEDVKSGNYAGLAGTAASLAIPEVAARGLPRLGRVTGAAEALEGSATRQYSRVLGATTRPNKFIGRQVIEGTPESETALGVARGTRETPGLLDRGVRAFTRKGLQKKFHEHISDVGRQLEQEWAKLPPGEGVPLDAVNSRLTQAGLDKFATETPSGQFLPTGPHDQAGLNFIGELKSYLEPFATVDANGAKVVPYEKIKKFRQDWDDLVAAAKGYQGSDLTNNVKAAAYKASANGLRDLLATGKPNIAAINREYSFWKKAATVIDETVLRTSSQAKPLGRKMARVGGQVLGFSSGGAGGAVLGGEVMDAIEAATNSTAWQTTSAVMKHQLADAIAQGSLPKVRRVTQAIVAGNVLLPRLGKDAGQFTSAQ